MKLLKQIRIAVVGLPDCGKSTFVKYVVKAITGKELSVDTLMNEVHYSDGTDIYGNADTRTIKCAKVMFKYRGYEICLYDCAGHKEYGDQIRQGLEAAGVVIKLVDVNRQKETEDYFNDSMFDIDKTTFTLYSHSNRIASDHYDVDNEKHFEKVTKRVLNKVWRLAKLGMVKVVDVEKEALEMTKVLVGSFNNVAMMFSGGKDSLVGLHLLKMCNLLHHVRVMFPCSGNDFDDVIATVDRYEKQYGIKITDLPNNNGKTPDKVSTFEWMGYKAKANNEFVKANAIDLLMVQYRASDEGVRSKDFHLVRKEDHYRFSPVFYFSESNIWRFISKHNLDVCPLYFEGYRSLGDKFCTEPCMDKCKNVESIVRYIENNPLTSERDGRTAQDKAEKFTMERLRNVGFF